MKFCLHLTLILALGLAAGCAASSVQDAFDTPVDPNLVPAGVSVPVDEDGTTSLADVLKGVGAAIVTVGLAYLGKRYGLPLVRKAR